MNNSWRYNKPLKCNILNRLPFPLAICMKLVIHVPFGMMNNFHSLTDILTKHPHSDTFGEVNGKSCKLGTHVPGDCGTIWCEIRSNKAKDGKDVVLRWTHDHGVGGSRPTSTNLSVRHGMTSNTVCYHVFIRPHTHTAIRSVIRSYSRTPSRLLATILLF